MGMCLQLNPVNHSTRHDAVRGGDDAGEMKDEWGWRSGKELREDGGDDTPYRKEYFSGIARMRPIATSATERLQGPPSSSRCFPHQGHCHHFGTPDDLFLYYLSSLYTNDILAPDGNRLLTSNMAPTSPILFFSISLPTERSDQPRGPSLSSSVPQSQTPALIQELTSIDWNLIYEGSHKHDVTQGDCSLGLLSRFLFIYRCLISYSRQDLRAEAVRHNENADSLIDSTAYRRALNPAIAWGLQYLLFAAPITARKSTATVDLARLGFLYQPYQPATSKPSSISRLRSGSLHLPSKAPEVEYAKTRCPPVFVLRLFLSWWSQTVFIQLRDHDAAEAAVLRN
ncbi:hypothetical protein QBC36DRAFT_307179 [Triangularia setosa]|uniref:Uncharacterized protein n=1 Tax=Triangularia setosa TaxID=2587417 RepID=A0AAN7ACE3_9PEZI|nr:hypothetical protein QBC36DRAFT_307179 [Podospora setosa]